MRSFAVAFFCVTFICFAVLASQGRGGEDSGDIPDQVELREDGELDNADEGGSFFVPDALLLTWYS